jgi:cbb3-type cytochrome oxidase subunit 3
LISAFDINFIKNWVFFLFFICFLWRCLNLII